MLTTNHFDQLFNGSEIVVAGRLMDNDLNNFLVEVYGQGVRRKKCRNVKEILKWKQCVLSIFFVHLRTSPLQVEEDFKEQSKASVVDWSVIYPDESYIFGDFTERLWAYLTIQQLLEKRSLWIKSLRNLNFPPFSWKRLIRNPVIIIWEPMSHLKVAFLISSNLLSYSKTGTTDEKNNATAEALEKSLQYSFVTPLTSMVVTRPQPEEALGGPLIANKLTEGKRRKTDIKRWCWAEFLWHGFSQNFQVLYRKKKKKKLFSFCTQPSQLN